MSTDFGCCLLHQCSFSRTSLAPFISNYDSSCQHLLCVCVVPCLFAGSPVSQAGRGSSGRSFADSRSLSIGARVAPVVSVILHIAIVNGQTKELIVLTTTE